MQNQIALGTLPSNASYADFDRVYRNGQFIDLYGEDEFNRYDPYTRDKMVRDKLVQQAFDEQYSGKATEEEYNEWNRLGTEAKLEMLNRGIQTQTQLDIQKNYYEGLQDTYIQGAEGQLDDVNFWQYAYNRGQAVQFASAQTGNYDPEDAQEERDKALAEIIARDKITRLAEAEPLTVSLTTQWQEAINNGEMDYSTIEQEFQKIAPYLNHYKAFVGEEELKNFSLENKMNAVAQYYAIAQQTGDAGVALSAVDGGIQNYISDQQDGWDKTKLFMGNLVTGTVGAILNEVNGLIALGYGGLGQVGSWLGMDVDPTQNVSDFLSSDWTQYWDGVDNFNTFSPGAINKARENGGVSANQRIRATGTEHDIDLNTIYDMGAMAKFIIPALLSKGAVSALTKGFGKLSTSLATKAVRDWGIKSTTARSAMNILNGGAGVAGALESGVGISNAYAMGTYSEVLAENNQKIDQLVDNHVQNQIKEYVAQGGDVSALTQADYDAMRARANQELDVVELEKQAELAATDAYIVNATMEAPRMALENALFRKWMLSKGTKANLGMENPYLRVANVEGSLTMMNKWQNRLKPILNNVWGGFESNYMDDVTARFGKEWGLANFNNYIAKSYDPTQYAGVVDGYMSPLLAAATGAGEAFGETQSFWDGFIGAGGSLIQLAPSGRWAKRMYQNRQAKKAGIEAPAENRTFLERLNDYVYNPILIEVEEALGRERRTSDRIVEINKYIAENKDKFDDIVNLAIADSRAVFGQRSGDMLTAADEKTHQLFELVNLYRKMQDDPIAREHSQMQQMNEMLQKISNSKSIDDIADLVQTSMSRPENQGTHPVTAEETYASIKDNAERFTSMATRLAEINKMFDETFDTRSVPESLRKQLSYQLVMGENWQERLDKIVQEQGLSPASTNNLTAQMGGKKGYDVRERAQSTIVSDLSEVIKSKKEELEGLQYHWVTKRGKNKKVKTKGNEKEISLLKKEIETLERTKQDAQAKLERMRTFDTETVETISADQMSSLSLEDLATMLDPTNRKYYSLAQQSEIDAFRDELVTKDPDAVQKIRDAAALQQRISDNKAAYNRLITSPSEAIAWDTEMKLRRNIAIQEVVREKRISDAMTEIGNLLANDQGSIPTTFGPDFLDEFIRRNPYTEDSMTPLKETSQLISDMSNYINLQEDLDDASRGYAQQTLYNLAKGVTSASQLVSKLESALESDALSRFDKDVINRALDKAEQLGLQRTSTTHTESSSAQTAPESSAQPVAPAEQTATTAENKVADTISQAISEGKSLKISYANASGQTSERTISDIQYKNGQQYIEVLDSKHNERRTFKVDRIQEATVVDTESQTQALTETMEDNTVSQDQVIETAEEVHTPTDEEVAESERTITTPDIDKVGEKFEEVKLSQEIELYDALDLTEEEKTTVEELADKVTGVTNPVVDTTEQGNIIPETNPEVLPGNKFPGYDYQVAADEAVLVKPQSQKEGDRMDTIHKWLESLNINLQDIIDNELHAILQVSPKVYFMGKKYTTKGDYVYDSLMLVAEYSPEVARIHNEQNGGVFTTNGKQYLLIGITGFNMGNAQQNKYYGQQLSQHKKKRNRFFSEHNREEYFVDESQYTEVKDFTSGRLIRQMSTEEPVQMRPVSELLTDDPATNPFGISQLSDLHWGIQYATEFKFVNEPTTGIAYPPTDASSNVGAVFIMMEAANGNFIPAAIAPALYTDLKEGRLKQQLDKLIGQLLSPSLDERRRANDQLMKFLSLDKSAKWILVGNENHDTVTLVDGETTIASFNLKDPNFSSMDFMEAFKQLNPRISITTSVLGNSTLLKMYDQAGALMTDIAKLGTSVSSYTIYPIGPDGTPIKTEPPFNGRPNLDANSDLSKAQAKAGLTQYYQGTQYRKRNGNWYKPGSSEPLTGELAEAVEYSNKVRQLEPDITAPGRSYYVLNNDRNSPVVVREDRNGTVRVLTQEESIKVLNHIAKIQEEARQAAAQEEALRSEYEGRVPTEADTQIGLSDVNLENAETEIASQLAGDFSSESNQVEVSEPVSPTETSSDSVLSSEDINSTSEVSMDELQGTKAPDTAAGIAASREWGDRLFEIVEKKAEDGLWEVSEDVLDDYVALTKFLENKGIPTTAITNVEGWLSLIEECK